MTPETRDAYLRKRLIRLLTKQRLELANGTGLPDGITVERARQPEVQADLNRVINAIEFDDVPVKQVTEPFIRLVLRTSHTHINSQRATIAITMSIITDLLSDEAGNARREHTVDLFKISWVSKQTIQYRKMQRRNRRRVT